MKTLRLQNITQLDKVILTNLKMIENEIAISCTLSLCMLFSVLFIISIIGVPFELAFAIYFLIKAHKKVFYTSIYGETAVFYQAFPISIRDMVVGKIIAMFTGLFIYQVITLACFLPFINIWSVMKEIGVDILQPDNVFLLSANLILELLASLALTLAITAVIFLAVTFYNNKKFKKNISKRILNVGFFLGIFFFPVNLNVSELFDIEYGLWMAALKIIIALLVTYFAAKKTIDIFEKKMLRR